MSKGKIRTRSTILHDYAESELHERHKREQRARRGAKWLKVTVAPEQPAPKRDFRPYLGHGEQLRVEETGKRTKLDGETYVKEFDQWVQTRSFYWGQKKRKKRRKDGTMHEWLGTAKIKCDAVDRLTITCAPWVSDYCFQLCAAGRVEEARDYLRKCTSTGVSLIQAETGREISYASRHYDTEHLHANFHSSYVGEGNFKKGDARLRTLGDGFVGLYRQYSVGVAIAPVVDRYEFDLAKYRERCARHAVEGQRAKWPLDAILSAHFDRLAEKQFGHDPLFQQAKKNYAAGVFKQYGATLAGQLEALDRKRTKLDEEIRILKDQVQGIDAAENVHSNDSREGRSRGR